MNRRLLVMVGLVATLVGVAATRPAAMAQVDRVADLAELRRWMTLEQSFTVAARAQAEKLLADYESEASEYTDAAFYMAVRRLVGLAENGHSNVSSQPIYQQFGLLPLRTYWFSDGLYVVRAQRKYEELLGARITAIEGTPLKDLEARLMQYHGGNRPAFRRFAAMPLMLSPTVLNAIGVAASPDELTLELMGADDTVTEVTIAVEPGPVRVGGTAPWRLLVATSLPGEGTGWVAARDPEASRPLYLRGVGSRFRSEWFADDVAYIQFRANIGRPGDSVRDFTAEVQEQLDARPPRAIILDNRHNGGGDLTRTADFALGLPELVREGGRVYVLTDHGTFSAGIYTSFFPKAADSERTVIVGEQVGDFPAFWAEAPDAVVLPQSGIRIGYAKQFHDIGNGCHDRSICHLGRVARWNIAVGSLDPDLPVRTTFAAFVAGDDPVLERVLAEIAG